MSKLIVPQLRQQKHGADFFAPVQMNREMRRMQKALERAAGKKK